MRKHEKVAKLYNAKELLEEALVLCQEAVGEDAHAEAYFLSSLRELAGGGGNPYNDTIDTMIERVVQDDPPDVEPELPFLPPGFSYGDFLK